MSDGEMTAGSIGCWPGASVDSAPRDGTEFLGYDPVCGKFDVVEWDVRLRFFWPTQSDGELGPLESDFQPERMTMWWPLPASPSGTL